MNSTPKIMVVQLKEIIYTILFVLLAILLILFLMNVFLQDEETNAETETGTYQPGTYTASLILNSMPMEVSVSVDENYIKSIELSHIDETVSVMYPLLEPSLKDIESHVIANQSFENISFENDNAYTCAVLVSAAKTAVEKALQ